MHNVICPAPWFMAQNPVYVAGTAEGGDAISGVQDGDIIVYFEWQQFSTVPSTPTGYTSVYGDSFTDSDSLAVRIAKKTAASESGSWPGNEMDTLILWFRNATDVDVVGIITGANSTAVDMIAVNMTKSGILVCSAGAREEYFNGSNLGFSSDFDAWSATVSGTYTAPGSGGNKAWQKIKHRTSGPGGSGTPAITGDGDPIVGGILINIY